MCSVGRCVGFNYKWFDVFEGFINVCGLYVR